MNDIEFRNVSKLYRIQTAESANPAKGLMARISRTLFPAREEFAAVSNVSFSVKRGEALGIIGHNGAGKSTMLKILSRITAPSAGEIMIRGRLAALLEVGSGFHQELTGRENIFLSASILGMRRSEIAARIENIIDFSGIRAFIDVPVKRYSSGMYVRLGFAIAAHLEPDVLLLDEVLAVGDASFQKKCLERVEELRKSGITIVFISHDLKAVQEICTRCLLMQKGRITADGPPGEVIRSYQQLGGLQPSRIVEQQRQFLGLANCRLTALKFRNEAGEEVLQFTTGSELRLSMTFETEARCRVAFVAHFCALDGTLLCTFRYPLDRASIEVPAGCGSIEFETETLPLQPGLYYIDAGVLNEDCTQSLDWHHNCYTIRVEPGIVTAGVFFMPQTSVARPHEVCNEPQRM